jgi:hypothetical protein
MDSLLQEWDFGRLLLHLAFRVAKEGAERFSADRLSCGLPAFRCQLVEAQRGEAMQKYVIERDLPGAGKMSASELAAISQKSNEVLRGMGPKIQWVQSYVTDDKIYCVYLAENEADIRHHAKTAGFPANCISQVKTIIDPISAS